MKFTEKYFSNFISELQQKCMHVFSPLKKIIFYKIDTKIVINLDGIK